MRCSFGNCKLQSCTTCMSGRPRTARVRASGLHALSPVVTALLVQSWAPVVDILTVFLNRNN